MDTNEQEKQSVTAAKSSSRIREYLRRAKARFQAKRSDENRGE